MPAKKKTKKKVTRKAEPTPHELLQSALAEVRDKVEGFRGGFGSEPEVKEMLEYPRFSTPIASLNRMVAGGFPGGKWTTIFGREKVGKTSLCLQTIAENMESDPNAIWCWFDVENSFDSDYAAALGIDLKRLIIVPAGMIMEDSMDSIISLSKTGALRGFIVDSMGSYVAVQELMTKKGVERGMREDTVTAVARKLSEFFRKATPQIARYKMCQVLIGHMYQKIDSTNPRAGMEQKGGHAVKHWAHLRLLLYRSNTQELKKDVVQPDGRKKECYVGYMGTILVDKTRQSATEGQSVEVPFIYGVGFDSVEATVRTALAMNVIEQRGAWFRYHLFPGDKCQIQGKDKMKQFVRDNPTVLSSVSDQILSVTDEMFGLKRTEPEDDPAPDKPTIKPEEVIPQL
jgi:recombination protein RecA